MADAAATPARKSRFVGPFHLMLVLLVGTYVALPLASVNPDEGAGLGLIVTAAVLCTAMLIGVRASRCPRVNLVWAQVVTGLIILSIVLSAAGVDTHRGVQLLFALLTFIAIKTILTSVLRAERVDADKIFAAVCVLFLLGWFWSEIYVFLDGPFFGPAFAGTSDESGRLELTYFSFVTLTTLGYGDIAPVTPFARTLVTLEALTGQLYLAILVARLVALHILHSKGEAEE